MLCEEVSVRMLVEGRAKVQVLCEGKVTVRAVCEGLGSAEGSAV